MPNNGIVKRGARSIDEERFETIRNHILDPEQYPLHTAEEERQLKRVQQAAMLMEEYPNEAHVITLMLQSHRVSRTQIRRDIALAKELFRTDFTFDWDFWRSWQIKDQLELIREAKRKGDLREWNNAKKLLHDIIGEKPEGGEDPRRMERNLFMFQFINAQGRTVQIPLDRLRYSAEDVATLIEIMDAPINDAQATEIMNS